MSNVGYATLPVIPSVRGIGSSIASQLTKPLVSESSDAGKSAGNAIKSGILGVARTIAGPLIAAVGVGKLVSGIRAAVDNASDLNEAGTAVEAVFGSAFPAIEQWSKGAARALGQSQLDALKAAQTFGVYGKAAGLADQANLDFSTGLVKLSGDLASFYNTSPEEAMQALAAGLRGESEPLRAYGVLLDDATLRQKALAMGLIETTKNALTPQQRVLAAQAAILEQTAVAQGDFTKTSAGLANQQRITAALWEDISSRIGTFFLPAVVAAQTAINERVLPAFSAAVDWLENRLPTAIQGVSIMLSQGVMSRQLAEAFNVTGDTPVIEWLFRIRDVIFATWQGASPALAALGQVFVQLGPPLVTLWLSLLPILDIFEVLVPLIPQVAGLIVALTPTIIALNQAGLQILAPLLQTVVSWLIQSADWLVKNQGVVVTLGAAWLAWRGVSATIGIVTAAQAAYTAATYGATGATYANVAASKAQAVAAKLGAAAQALMQSSLARSLAGWVANTAAVATNSSLTLGTKAAIIASSVATGIATAAQWAWNAALSANPIGIIIVAIAALVAGIIWLATQTTFFQDLWTNVCNVVGTAATWLWENVLQPAFTAIGAVFQWIYENIIRPVVSGVLLYIGLWAAVITWLWENVVQPVFAFIASGFQWLYANVIAPIIDGIQTALWAWGEVTNVLWQTVVQPVFNAIGAIFQWVYQSIIVPIVDAIQLSIRGWGMIFTWLWQNAINPAIQAVAAGMNWVWSSIIQPVVNFINDAISNVGNVFRDVFNGLVGFVANAFNGIVGVIRGPINSVISLANSAIRGLNSISLTIPDWVPEWGGKTFGISIPTIPMLASGANVRARQGGTLAILGEGGRSETVTDLGLTNRMMAATLALVTEASPATDESVNFNGPVTVADPDELARKVQTKRRRAKAKAGVDRKVAVP